MIREPDVQVDALDRGKGVHGRGQPRAVGQHAVGQHAVGQHLQQPDQHEGPLHHPRVLDDQVWGVRVVDPGTTHTRSQCMNPGRFTLEFMTPSGKFAEAVAATR